ncbi:NADH-quinone oxidoreductase subunit NuoN [endosymbiont of unidentified scaly snail isolate Monju]|uniref:NADH-quinone oxidoreductase subunit NuoN n=1 Tax=endosymbiont of unidentified scaly snail isolate Monju TaxID=1248727 RepID=UPI0003892BA9|nr:NADH-quinone oxidoreductase subunit NuoN [endosymbiont of unidentified scaly snail isolate Monju]BAN69377.1 NADH-quinone oxidoreductase subunit N [endosymbiont of unidentified scaly snail isolate Monju]
MQYDLTSLQPVLPELFLLGAACLVLVVDLFLSPRTRMVSYGLSLMALLGTIALVAWVAAPERQTLFAGSFVRDPVADVLKIALLSVGVLALAYGRGYLLGQGIYRGEYFILALFALLGMMIMASAGNFLTLYLGLELLALSVYALVAFDRDSLKGAEAAMKYFVLGALASGMLLYGISMLYGATGSLTFTEVAEAIGSGEVDETVLVFGLVFVVIGVAFKFGAVPFHMWVPDVYHGAPTAVTLFLGSAPKIAAFALALRLLVDGAGGLSAHWADMLTILAVLSLAIGNIVAIAQTNLKRMLAYSTISHVGFIFLGFIAANDKGYSAALFYTVVYALTAAGGFGLLAMLSRRGFDAENLHDLKGLNDRSPWLAGMLLLILFSMAGVPPTVGFFAKLFVLEAVVSVDKVWLAGVAVFFSIIGAFYYLRAVKMMYFDKPIDDAAIEASIDSRMAFSVNGVAMLLFGLFPAGLLEVCRAAFAG